MTKTLMAAAATAAMLIASPVLAQERPTDGAGTGYSTESSDYGINNQEPALQKPNSSNSNESGNSAATGAGTGEGGTDLPDSSPPESSAQPDGENEPTQPAKPLQKQPSSTGEQ